MIGDVENEFLHNINDEDDVEPLVDNNNLPGVHTAEADDKIPGVDMVQEQDVDVDLDFAPANEGNVNPPLVDIPPPVNDAPVVSDVPTDGGTHRSMQVCTQLKPQYIPAFSGKLYSFATTALGTRILDDVDYSYNQLVVFSLMQQLSVKTAFREWGDNAKVAGEKEVNQLHWRKTFVSRQMLELTAEQQTKILQSHMFIGQKRTGETKARMVAGGNTQWGHMTKEELSSPTVSTKAVLLTSIVDAHKGRDVAVIDIPNAFIQIRVHDAKDCVIVCITGVIVDWLVKVSPKVYASYVATNSRGEISLLVECYNAIYGTMVADLLYYRKFSSSLKKRGFAVNPYDPCVWNRDIKGKQMTIFSHVNDCKILHLDPKVVNYTIAWLREEYESVFTDGSRKMKVAQGKVHKYLGMTLEFATSKIVKVTMLEYVDEIVGSWDKACSELDDGYNVVSGCKMIAATAPNDLFKVDEDAVKLDQVRAKAFHNIAAKGIYVTKRARPDMSLAIAFLTTRVKGPDIDNWCKLRHLVEYLQSTCDLPLILVANGTGVLSWYVDALFAVHPDMGGHTGGAMTMGRGFPLDKSTIHKLNTRSSMESENFAVNDLIPQILWTRLFMKAQGFVVRDNILYQDNKSAMLLRLIEDL